MIKDLYEINIKTQFGIPLTALKRCIGCDCSCVNCRNKGKIYYVFNDYFCFIIHFKIAFL